MSFFFWLRQHELVKPSSLDGTQGHTKAGYHGDTMSLRPSTILWEPVSVRKKLGRALGLPAGGVRESETIEAVGGNGCCWFA